MATDRRQKDAVNITKRENGIYRAEIKVPSELRPVIGKSKLTKSLKTRDKRRAVIEAGPILDGFYRQLELARTAPDQYVKLIAQKNLQGRSQAPDQWGYTQAEADTEGWLDSLPEAERKRYEPIAHKGVPYSSFVDAFIDSYANLKTAKDARRSVLEMAEWAKTLDEVGPSAVRKWKQAEAQKSNSRASGTLSKVLTFNAEYFAYLQDQELISDELANPFKGVKLKDFTSKESYQALTLEEILTIRDAAAKAGDSELVEFIDIARHTGMRIAEIASATVVSVEGVECWKVKADAKTKASSGRLVPVASAISGLTSGQPERAGRHDAVSKRFGRLKRVVLEDGASRTKVFHSIRKYVATTLEREGVPEGITADLLGHEKQTMTYGVYSSGSSIEQLVGAVKKLEKAQK